MVAIGQAYTDWLQPSCAGLLLSDCVVEDGPITRIENKSAPLSKNTIIIRTDGLDADQVYHLFESQLIHLIFVTSQNRKKNY